MKAAAMVGGLIALALLAAPASALELELERASDRALAYADRTCSKDRHCVAHGVVGCRRHSRLVALCTIFDERRTQVQGRYRCERLVRFSLDSKTRRLPITGLGRWRC